MGDMRGKMDLRTRMDKRRLMDYSRSGASAPTFVSATTNTAGTVVTVTFSKTMADPTGKHAQFTVNDGASNTVTAVALNVNTAKIDLTLTNAIDNGDTVTVAYTAGTVLSADGGVLASFTAQAVTNTVPVPAPTFVSAETSEDGETVTVTFSKTMADPSGKHAQFAVDDGAANAVTAAALNEDTTKIDLTLTNVIENGDTVTVSYTAGDVEAADGGVLGDFEAESVTNNVPSLYQEWSGYPNSPVLTASYPYQVIDRYSANPIHLAMSTTPFYNASAGKLNTSSDFIKVYYLNAGSWVFQSNTNNYYGEEYTAIYEANNDIYTNSGLGTVYFTQTTP
jgi:uncharacterized repeat protein (TIGR02059 family)